MYLKAPNPRYRIYSKASYYIKFFTELITGIFHRGNEVALLEQKLKERFGVPHAICTPMARVAIHLAIKNTIKPGQKVIMSPYTIADVVNMVIAAKGIPVFADIERETCNINPQEIEKLIDENTGAVFVTHLHGLGCKMDQITKICREKNVPLIEDCAQAFGTRYKGKPVGTFGKAGIYSLGMYKNINCWYGGVVITHDDMLAQKIREEVNSWGFQKTFFMFKRMFKSLRADVMTWPPLFKSLTFWIFRYGFINDIEPINKLVRTELDTSRRDYIPENYKGRLTPYQARLILGQLDKIDGDTEVRIRYAHIYRQVAAQLKELIIPPFVDGFEHIYTYYPIQFAHRDELIKWMMYHNCDMAAQHLKNCADLDSFKEFYRDCPNARLTSGQVILLPTYPRYEEEYVHKNAEVLKRYFEKR